MSEELTISRRSTFIFLFLIAIDVFLLTAHLDTTVQTLKNFAYYVIMPTPAAASAVIQTARETSMNLMDIVHAHQENIRLRKELIKYAGKEQEWENAREENIRLHQLINFPPVPDRVSVPARIVSRESSAWFQWMIINRGREEGITLDAPVFAWSNNRPCAVGRVTEVHHHSSKVVLITNALSAIVAKERTTDEDGLLEGQNTFELTFNYLAGTNKVRIGDEIVTSPLSTVFPPDIQIGRVKELVVNKGETFVSAFIEPAANFNSLREVVVEISKE